MHAQNEREKGLWTVLRNTDIKEIGRRRRTCRVDMWDQKEKQKKNKKSGGLLY